MVYLGQGCDQKPDVPPTVTVGTRPGSPDSPLDFSVELEGLQFVVTVENTSTHPVTISTDNAPIWLLFHSEGFSPRPDQWASVSRPKNAKRTKLKKTYDKNLRWLFEGEKQTYRTEYTLTKDGSQWNVSHPNHKGWNIPPNIQELTDREIHITPRYFEVRTEFQRPFDDPFKTKERGYGKEHILHLPN